MNREGPTLELLLRRVAETPSDFLAEPLTTTGRGMVHVPAVVGDLLAFHGHQPPDLGVFTPDPSAPSRRRASITLLLCCLLAEPELVASGPSRDALLALLTDGASELAAQNAPLRYRDDPERREELVRFTLARLDLRPSGETPAQAQDRLSALNSTERTRVLAASRAAEERSRAIREALARKAAQESADKYTRE